MLLNREARDHAVGGGVGLHGRRVEEELLPPHKPRLEALLHDPLEEQPKDLEPVALADPREAGVVGQRLVEVVSQIPADAKAVGHNLHQLPLASQSLEEKNKLEFKEDYRVDTRAARGSVAILDHIPHKREVKSLLQVAVEVVLRDEFFERKIGQWGEVTELGTHHGCASPPAAGTREAHASAMLATLLRAHPDPEGFSTS